MLLALTACAGTRDAQPVSFAYRRQALDDLILFRAAAALRTPIDGCSVFKMLDNDPNYLERLGAGQKRLIAQRDPSECANDALFVAGERLVVQEINRAIGGLNVVATFIGPGHSYEETYFLREIHSGNQGTPTLKVESLSWDSFAYWD